MEPVECKSKDDIIKYLTSRLAWNDDPPVQKGWVQQFGYRQAYWIHQLWFHPETGRYAFHSDEFDNWNTESDPNLGMYSSFNDMLQGVAEVYKNLWESRSGNSLDIEVPNVT